MVGLKTPVKKRRRSKSAKVTRQQVITATKRAEALEYRLKGAGYAQIGQWMKCSTAYAARLVEAAITEIPKEPAEKVIAMELNRLDVMLFALDAAVSNGEQTAIQTALRIMDRRARYLGLDAPAKTEVSGNVTISHEEWLTILSTPVVLPEMPAMLISESPP